MSRKASMTRNTKETKITIAFEIDGTGATNIETGIPFMDHMLELFARHGYFDLDVAAQGDLEVDAHHTMEDLGIVLGQVIREALGDKRGICRYGCYSLPMDESLVNVALDLSGRPYLVFNVDCPVDHLSGIGTRLFQEFFQALTNNLALNLHIDLVRGEETHHILEAVFKSFSKALDRATALDPREKEIPSTKGMLS